MWIAFDQVQGFGQRQALKEAKPFTRLDARTGRSSPG
jgi:hypothetical protein